jgi:hypothetical protein
MTRVFEDIWRITILRSDGKTPRFSDSSPDKATIEAVAAEARKQRPRCQILIRDPLGFPLTWRNNRICQRRDIQKRADRNEPMTDAQWNELENISLYGEEENSD